MIDKLIILYQMILTGHEVGVEIPRLRHGGRRRRLPMATRDDPEASGLHLPDVSRSEDRTLWKARTRELLSDDSGKAVVMSGRVSVASMALESGLPRFLLILGLGHPCQLTTIPLSSPYLATNYFHPADRWCNTDRCASLRKERVMNLLAERSI